MLVFSTRLPIKSTVKQEDCLRLFIKWVIDSPNYSIDSITYDVSSHKDFDCNKDNYTFSIRHYKDDSIEISACRLENKDTSATWINDCIFIQENGEKFLLIQLNCICTNYDTKLPHIHKPYIVRQFVESGYCKDDVDIPITDTPLDADNTYYDTCVSIMNGTASYTMPVVYLSCDYWGKTALSADYMAKQLSGVAHVFVEKNYETSLKLKNDTNGNNVHTEYIGVYFPDKKYCQKFSLKYYSNYKIMSKDIIDSVWKAIVNRLDSSAYNWHHIIALQARQKMTEFENISRKDKEQLSEFMDTFDAEHDILRNQIEELNAEVFSLRSQLDSLRLAFNGDSSGSGFYKPGTESDLYLGEKSDLLYSILSQVQSRYDANSRPYTLIQTLLEANPKVGEGERVMAGITSVFSGDGRLNKNSKSQLKNLGFSIEEDGSHYKITFHDPRYMFTVSKTPGDYREGKNLISEIRNMLDNDRKI